MHPVHLYLSLSLPLSCFPRFCLLGGSDESVDAYKLCISEKLAAFGAFSCKCVTSSCYWPAIGMALVTPPFRDSQWRKSASIRMAFA